MPNAKKVSRRFAVQAADGKRSVFTITGAVDLAAARLLASRSLGAAYHNLRSRPPRLGAAPSWLKTVRGSPTARSLSP